MSYTIVIVGMVMVFILTLFLPYVFEIDRIENFTGNTDPTLSKMFSTSYSRNKEISTDTKEDNSDTANPQNNPAILYDTKSAKTGDFITYHNSYTPKSDYGELPPGKMYFPNPDGTMKVVDIMAYDNSRYYYETGSYSTGPRDFSPIEESTVYMSELQGVNIKDKTDKSPIYLTGSQVVNTSTILGGFCTQYAKNPDKLEELCRRVDPDQCATTTCCALLGGQRCVSANQEGPIMKSNYSDYLIANRDFYYYQGKCYGICPSATTLLSMVPTTPAVTTASS